MRTFSPTTTRRGPLAAQAPTVIKSRAGYALWFVMGTALSFVIPFLFSSILGLQHDLYYLVYFTLVLNFLGLFAKAAHIRLSTFSRYWPVSFGLGVLIAAWLVMNVLNQPATAHPTGPYFAFELVWRGALYGLVDALLLSAFPCLVAYGLWNHSLHGIGRKIGYWLTALLLVISITAIYHVGFTAYRSAALANPEVGNTIISIPTLFTVNPLGSLIAHPVMHVTAVVHQYQGNVFTPPQVLD